MFAVAGVLTGHHAAVSIPAFSTGSAQVCAPPTVYTHLFFAIFNMRLRAKNELVEVINLFKNPENSTFYIAKKRCVYTVGAPQTWVIFLPVL